MTIGNSRAFSICSLLMFFIVSVIAVDQIAKLAYCILDMDRFDFSVVKMGICRTFRSACHATIEAEGTGLTLELLSKSFQLQLVR